MNLFKNFILIILAVFTVQNKVYAQDISIKEFRKLDSLAFMYYENNNATKAESIAFEIIEKAKGKKPNLFIINAYTLLGIINKNRGYYISSLENYIHALNLSEKIKDAGRVSACLNNIGVIYQLQSNYVQSIKYFTKSLEIEEKGKNPLQKSIRYYNLGDSYKELDSLDIALSYFNNSLIIEEKNKNNEGIVYAYLGIAEVYIGLKNYFQANMVLDKIEGKLKKEQLDETIVFNKLKGNYLYFTGDYSSALSYLDQGISASNKHKLSAHLLSLYLLKIDCYEMQGEISNANKWYKIYIKLNDQLKNSEIKNKIEDLTYQNELTKKELEIKLVLEERNLALRNHVFEKNLRIYEQKITWFVVLLLVLTIGLVFYGIKKITTQND